MIKLLGLSLLAAVGVMAVSAASAQATYVLLRNNVTVSSLSLKGTGLLGELLSNINIHCTKSKLTATATNLLPTSPDTDVKAHVLYEECTVVGNPFCTISNSVGKADKLILAQAGGKLTGDSGTSLFGLASSANFATIRFEAPLCVLPASEVISGSLKLTLLNFLTETKVHLVHVDEEAILLGETPAFLDGGETHVEEATGASWSIHLK
jgi:hypothetical protein